MRENLLELRIPSVTELSNSKPSPGPSCPLPCPFMEVSCFEISEYKAKILDYLLDGITPFFFPVFLKSSALGEVVDFSFYIMTFTWSTF